MLWLFGKLLTEWTRARAVLSISQHWTRKHCPRNRPTTNDNQHHDRGVKWEAMFTSSQRCTLLLSPHFSALTHGQWYDHLCFLPRSPTDLKERTQNGIQDLPQISLLLFSNLIYYAIYFLHWGGTEYAYLLTCLYLLSHYKDRAEQSQQRPWSPQSQTWSLSTPDRKACHL